MSVPTPPAEPTEQQRLRRRVADGVEAHDEATAVRRHVIVVRLNNHIGALNRVSNLFSARGFNLESVTVGPTEDPEVSRLTLVTSGSPRQINQALRHLDNLIDTLEVTDLTAGHFVERELAFVKVSCAGATRSEVKDLADLFNGRIVDVSPDTMTVQVTGPGAKIDSFIRLTQPYGIVELARSGRVAMRRDAPTA
jgi:acetolactate synthase-1/3 small subunit